MTDTTRTDETESVTCADCGDTVELHPADAAFYAGETTFTCEPCHERQIRERLERALTHGDDETFSRAKAALHLRHDYPDAFPVHDPDHDRWILTAEHDTLDGYAFLGKMETVESDRAPCPECGDTRRCVAWGSDGVIDWHREVCTICDHVYEEDAG